MMSDFHAKVGVAMHSPYFSEPPKKLDGEPLIEWYAIKTKERAELKSAALDVESETALSASAKALLAKALKSLKPARPKK